MLTANVVVVSAEVSMLTSWSSFKLSALSLFSATSVVFKILKRSM